jgi:sugar/nucleoside kinase (ribokinase family)
VQVKIARAVSPASLVSLSPGAFYARRGIAALTPLAARCDVLFVNRDEICTLMAVPADGYAVAAQRFLSQFTQCEAVAVTLGAGEHAGVHRITSRVFRRSQPDFRIASSDRPEVTDATGAGDAFAAGYLYGLLTGEATERCALFGHVLAQFALAGTGACASLPSRAEFRRAVELSPTRVITGLSQTSPAGRIGRQQFDSAAVKAGDAAAVGEVNLPGMRLDNLFPVP